MNSDTQYHRMYLKALELFLSNRNVLVIGTQKTFEYFMDFILSQDTGIPFDKVLHHNVKDGKLTEKEKDVLINRASDFKNRENQIYYVDEPSLKHDDFVRLVRKNKSEHDINDVVIDDIDHIYPPESMSIVNICKNLSQSLGIEFHM